MNNILWRAIKWVQIPAVKEPISLLQHDGKHPHGTTLLLWAQGKPAAWDVTVPDTYAESHISQKPGKQELLPTKHQKTAKYRALSVSHIFVNVAVETAGTWGQSAIELVQEIGKRKLLRTQRNHVLNSAAVYSAPKGQCDRLP